MITGASSGIGLGLAEAFLQDGANVVLNSSNAEKLKSAAATLAPQDRIALVAGDIGDPATGDRLVAIAVDRFGGVDVLVNNAGRFAAKPFLESSEDDLDQYYRTNLKGTYFATQAAVQQLKKQGKGGAIINIGTVLVTHSLTNVAASAALTSKGAIHALTTSLASELAPDNIRVNIVAPGIIRTPIHNGYDVDDLARLHLLNRVGEVQEVVDAVLHLANAEFTTGVNLPVDGGHIAGRL
ncbi:MAG: SDR family NAD(P)-dependent oxidoreductase [Pseudomonadales bacterium]